MGNPHKHLSQPLEWTKFGAKILSPTFLLIFVLANMTSTQVSTQPTTVQILPESYTVPDIGSTFTINISIQNVNNLYAWELKLYYPSDILNGTTVAEGPFLKTENQPTFFRVLEFTDEYNNAQGRIIALCSRFKPGALGARGDGILATITFTSKSANGPKILHLEDVTLIDSNENTIPCTTTNSEVTVISELPTTLIPLILIISTLLTIAYRKTTQPKRFGNTAAKSHSKSSNSPLLFHSALEFSRSQHNNT